MHFVVLNFDSQHLPNSFYRRSTDPNVSSIKGELKPLPALPAFRVTREMRSKEPFAQCEQIGIALPNTESQQFVTSKIGKDARQHRQSLLDGMLPHTAFPHAQDIF